VALTSGLAPIDPYSALSTIVAMPENVRSNTEYGRIAPENGCSAAENACIAFENGCSHV
jgi:hypothetical protein